MLCSVWLIVQTNQMQAAGQKVDREVAFAVITLKIVVSSVGT